MGGIDVKCIGKAMRNKTSPAGAGEAERGCTRKNRGGAQTVRIPNKNSEARRIVGASAFLI